MEQVDDDDKAERDIIDEVKMGEVKSAMQAQVIPDDDDDEEDSPEHIEDFMKKKDLESQKGKKATSCSPHSFR